MGMEHWSTEGSESLIWKCWHAVTAGMKVVNKAAWRIGECTMYISMNFLSTFIGMVREENAGDINISQQKEACEGN